jgi:peptide deformylase
MAHMEIRRLGDPVLREVAKAVPKVTKRIIKLLRDMEETMYVADGVGLAAPQVGVSERIVVLDAGDGPMHLINPQIVAAEGSDIETEGCLSIPGVSGYVNRATQVTVTWMDAKGKEHRTEANGMLARVMQHEIDHLDGVLFIDKATGVKKPVEQEE